MQNICVRVAVEKDLLHAIAARDGMPVTAQEVQQETGTDLLLISMWRSRDLPHIVLSSPP